MTNTVHAYNYIQTILALSAKERVEAGVTHWRTLLNAAAGKFGVLPKILQNYLNERAADNKNMKGLK